MEQAVAAGASFRVGNQYAKGNLSDQLIAQYLQVKGYQEESLPGYSRWTPIVTNPSVETIEEQMYGPTEGTIDPITSRTSTLPTTDKGPSNIDTKLNDQLGGKSNLDDLGFEEGTCEIPN